MKEIDRQHKQTFSDIRRLGEDKTEYWSARDLQPVLEYSNWQNFTAIIKKAIKACKNSGMDPSDHFTEVIKMVALGSGAKRKTIDYHLSRYACYLIVQNGDPSKPVIADGQTYFAIQTRRQELADDKSFQRLGEDAKRMFLRNELKEHNKQLMKVASHAGVESGLDFAIFQNHGYQGLYEGLDARGIHRKKGLKKSQSILDHMEAPNLRPIYFGRHRRKISWNGKTFKAKTEPTGRTLKLERRSAKPLRIWAVQYRKNFPHPKPA